MVEHNLIAIDLAKSVFQVCVMKGNRVVVNKQLRRGGLLEFVLQQDASVVAMEACYSSHYWARLFQAHGFEIQMIPAQHVKPFRRGNKNDHNDAVAVAEASRRPNIRFVPVKTIEQQDIQSLHRLRERWLRARLALTNQARGLLSEYGVVFGKGDKAFREGIAAALDNPDLSPVLKEALIDIQEEYHFIQHKLQQIKTRLIRHSRQDSNSRLLESIPGIGPVIATAVTSTVYNGAGFANAREFAVWTGLTPKQSSSGDKCVTSGVTKRGNAYLRKQLVHGARAAMRWSRYRDDEFSRWVNRLIARQGYNKAAVAVAHRLARIIWILLQKQERFVVRA